MTRSPEHSADRLRTIILDQSAQGVAVPVLLFPPEPPEVVGSPGDATPPVPGADAVGALADRLGVELDGLELYTPDAYLLQCALGQQLVGGDGLTGVAAATGPR